MGQESVKKVIVLATGGTISGRAAAAGDNIAYTAGLVGVAELMAALPSRAGGPVELVGEQLAQVDSKDMDHGLWRQLAERCAHHLAQAAVQGVVITHGTDTMEETAYFLHALLGAAAAQAKPVVITGAMRPASALSPDGPQNMLDALAVAGHPGACGVVVAMAGKVLSAVEVQKVHPYRRDAFDAFDGGVLGYVEEGRLRMVRTWPAKDGYCLPQWPRGIADTPWPRVEILMSHAGAGGALVDALLADASAGSDPLRGLVVAGTGNGTVHRALEAALQRARERGVVVVRATRCCQGRVLPTGADVFEDSEGLSPVKARIRVMLSLMTP